MSLPFWLFAIVHRGLLSDGGLVRVTITTKDQAQVLFTDVSVPLKQSASEEDTEDPTSAVRVTVNPSQSFQTILGFGAALTDSSAYVISRARPQVQDELLQRLFGSASKGGARLNILRISIGVSDFSLSYRPGNISYDDTTGDYGLQHFSIARDEAYLLPMLRKILAINPDMLIMASPWTAPLWLKNVSMLGKGLLKDDDTSLATYAEYLVRYLEDYDREGVRIDYLSLQNEPGHGNCDPMPCMRMSPEQQIRLATLVGRLLRSSPSPHVAATKLLAYDHNWGPTDALPRKMVWNVWLLVILLAPTAILGSLGSMVACCIWGRRSAEARTAVVTPSGEAFLRGKEYSDNSSSSGHSSDSDCSSRSGSDMVAGLVAKRSFTFGACCGVAITVMSSWTTVLLTTRLYITERISEKISEPDLTQTFSGVNWPVTLLESEAGHEFAGVAWHCYGGSPEIQSELQARLSYRASPIEQHMTECSGGDWSGPWSGSLFWNQKVLIMRNFQNHGQSVVQWNLALDEKQGPHCTGGACCETCRGVVTVPSKASSIDRITYNVEFVGLAHHATFVGPGAVRVFSEVSDDEYIHAIAYRNADNSLVAVAVNDHDHDSFDIQVSAGRFSFVYRLPPGVATFAWEQPAQASV